MELLGVGEQSDYLSVRPVPSEDGCQAGMGIDDFHTRRPNGLRLNSGMPAFSQRVRNVGAAVTEPYAANRVGAG